MNTVSGFTWGAIGFAFLAALLWWGASAVTAMPHKTVPGLGNSGGAVQQAVDKIKRQSRWASAAAAMAGCAAMLQAISLIVGQLS